MTKEGLVKIGRAAKMVALFGFFLPWILVSCNGQEIASGSGFDLIMGSLSAKNPMTGAAQAQHIGTNVWVLLGGMAAVLGLVASFLLKDVRAQAGAITAMAVTAFLFCGVGMATATNTRNLNKQAGATTGTFEQQLDASMAQMIRIEPKFGFWLTLLALATAGAAGGVAAGRKEGELSKMLSGGGASAS